MPKPATLDDVQAFNDQLAALREAGVPIDLGLGPSGVGPGGDLNPVLQWTDASLGRRIARGEPLESALADPDLPAPPIYRAKLLAGVRSGDLPGLLAESNDLTTLTEARSRTRWAGAGYALLVVSLVFLGLVFISLYLTPVAEDLYRDLRIEPTKGGARMVLLRQTLPFWAWTPAVAALLALAWRYSSRGQQQHALPHSVGSLAGGESGARIVAFTASVADLLDHQTPLPEALALAAEANGCEVQDAKLPPLLSWALGPDVADADRAAALRTTGQVYRRALEQRSGGARETVAMVCWMLVAGAAVLAYGAALFAPFVELLVSLAKPSITL